MKQNRVKNLAIAAMIGALFVALTLVSSSFGLAIGPIEVRLSEALCFLPIFTPAAIPGLFVGCVLSNLLCGAVWLDVLFGSLATLFGAIGTYFWRKKKFLPFLPPIFFNSLIVPPILYFVYGFQDAGLPLLFLSIFLGEFVSAGVLGYLAKKGIEKKMKRFL